MIEAIGSFDHSIYARVSLFVVTSELDLIYSLMDHYRPNARSPE